MSPVPESGFSDTIEGLTRQAARQPTRRGLRLLSPDAARVPDAGRQSFGHEVLAMSRRAYLKRVEAAKRAGELAQLVGEGLPPERAEKLIEEWERQCRGRKSVARSGQVGCGISLDSNAATLADASRWSGAARTVGLALALVSTGHQLLSFQPLTTSRGRPITLVWTTLRSPWVPMNSAGSTC